MQWRIASPMVPRAQSREGALDVARAGCRRRPPGCGLTSPHTIYGKRRQDMPPLPLVQGTLNLLVLRTLASGPSHGYGVATAVHERTGGELAVEDAALYQALHRLDRKGLVHAEWRPVREQPPCALLRAHDLWAASGCGRRWPTGGVIPAPSRRWLQGI